MDAGAHADAQPHRDQHDVARTKVRGGKAADEIEVALARREALEQLLAVVEVVDQHEHLVRVAADIEADRRAGPIRSEEHTSELQSLMRSSYAVFCLKHKKPILIKYSTSRPQQLQS